MSIGKGSMVRIKVNGEEAMVIDICGSGYRTFELRRKDMSKVKVTELEIEEAGGGEKTPGQING